MNSKILEFPNIKENEPTNQENFVGFWILEDFCKENNIFFSDIKDENIKELIYPLVIKIYDIFAFEELNGKNRQELISQYNNLVSFLNTGNTEINSIKNYFVSKIHNLKIVFTWDYKQIEKIHNQKRKSEQSKNFYEDLKDFDLFLDKIIALYIELSNSLAWRDLFNSIIWINLVQFKSRDLLNSSLQK